MAGRRRRSWRGSRRSIRPDGFPPPELVLASSEIELRACGFSGSKIAAMRAICAAALDGTVPTRRGSRTLVGRGTDRAADLDPRRGAVDGGDAADLHAGPAGRAAGGRFRCARRLSGCCTGWRCSRSRRRWRRSGWPGRRIARSPRGICGARRTRASARSCRRRGREGSAGTRPVKFWRCAPLPLRDGVGGRGTRHEVRPGVLSDSIVLRWCDPSPRRPPARGGENDTSPQVVAATGTFCTALCRPAGWKREADQPAISS